MKRLDFIKNALLSLPILATKKEDKSNAFTFDELFIVHEGNERLIYPRKESAFYKEIEKTFIDRIVDSHHIYSPVHHLSISVKDAYTFEDFLPVKYYFQCVYAKNEHFTTDIYDVCFRFIRSDDRMHLDVFLG